MLYWCFLCAGVPVVRYSRTGLLQIITSPPVGRQSIVITASVCVFVCPRAYLWNYTSDLHKKFVHVTDGPGSVLLCRCCDMLCTFGCIVMSYLQMHRRCMYCRGASEMVQPWARPEVHGWISAPCPSGVVHDTRFRTVFPVSPYLNERWERDNRYGRQNLKPYLKF